jgi:DnaK suppressor protein
LLNPADIESIRTKILAQLKKLEVDIKEYKELTKPISPENAIGRISRMDAINNKSVNEAALHNSKNKLVRLQRSLSELESKSFGLCRQCGEEIELAKLLVMPESIRCVTCVKSAR